MAEFTVIETQEQLDKIIGERIARAEKKAEEAAAKQYADYDDLKKKVSDYEAQITNYGKQLTDAQEALKTVDDLKAQIKAHETASVKTRIAHEVGLPYELANRLSGETEEEIRKDAETLTQYTTKHVAPLASTEKPIEGNDLDAAYKKALEKLTHN